MIKKIIDYQVVQGDLPQLTALVRNAIISGWEPIGGIALAANRPSIGVLNCTYAQAMVLSKVINPPPLPTLDEVSVNCPECGTALIQSELSEGSNSCKKCGCSFIVEK